LSRPDAPLRRVFALLAPHRSSLLESWSAAVAAEAPGREVEARALCEASLDQLFGHLERGDAAGLIAREASQAGSVALAGGSARLAAQAIRSFDRCCLPILLEACPEREALAEVLLCLDELGDRRLEALLFAQEEESARRLAEAQDQAARAGERAQELTRLNDNLRRSERRSQHRAEQIALLSSVIHRIAGVMDPERLMEDTARMVQARMGHTFVAVVVLDEEGVLIGRFAGRGGIARHSAGRAQGPPGGIIGRALRRRAPQVVPDVARDPDYHPDVEGTKSEMVVPLLENGEAVGAIDFQSPEAAAFDLDDVVAAEILAEFLMVAFRNARLFAARREAQP
jgi:putative methionine-R-sulfoxide reductase with GAF domain